MIADGEVPMPSIGTVLRDRGIRVTGEVSAAQPEKQDGIAALPGGAPDQVVYEVTGRAGEPRDVGIGTARGVEHAAAEFVITVGTDTYQVQFPGGWAHEVVTGSRVTVTGKLWLIGDYEWDAFELTESRADWQVHGVVKIGIRDTMLDVTALRGSQ